jgi:hypothetical protein
MHLPKELLAAAQEEDRACARLVRAVELVAEFTPSLQSHKVGGGTVTCTVCSAVLCDVIDCDIFIYCDIYIDVILALADQSGKTVSYSSMYFILLITYRLFEALNSNI